MADPKTPQTVAQALFAAVPSEISSALLEEYGIRATLEQARVIAREVLSLNLFWVFSAINAHVPRESRAAVVDCFLNFIQQGWKSRFNLDEVQWSEYLAELQTRRDTYARVEQERGDPVSVASKTVEILEDHRMVRDEDRTKFLTFVIDCVPVETYSQMLQYLG